LDKDRLTEALRLKTELGEGVWPGWGKMEIPVLLWNQENNYLFGVNNPPDSWEKVPDDNYLGETYFRNPDFDPENFAVFIGKQWVSSAATKGETDLFLQRVFRDVLPDYLEVFFPFRILILNSEFQICGVLHESFHVYQAKITPIKFSEANSIYHNEGKYWEIDNDMHSTWKDEMDILIKAVESETDEETTAYTRRFLDLREKRRLNYKMTPNMVSFERQIEWLEGVAKYIELTMWETASQTSTYDPIPNIKSDPDFKDYKTFNRRWSQEISQARRQAIAEGDIRFYYSGMLQAKILAKLLPEWKSRIMEDDIYLEDLLANSVAP